MMKLVVIICVLFTLFFTENLALDANNYIAYIEKLSRNEKFLEEYAKWSSELFSQGDYLFGDFHAKFPCTIDNSTNKNNISTSVHTLRPSDIKCIGAIGDSFTTGLGARAITPMDLLLEDRGVSWSIGGDYTYSKILTIPNLLRQYNPELKGFSTGGNVMTTSRQSVTNNRLNVAISGDHSNDMLDQAETLIYQLQNTTLCDWKNDWKMITVFAGANDLCSFCEDSNETKYTPEQYLASILYTLDILYNASIPRMFINLVLPPDVRGIKDLRNSGYICQTLLREICPCAAFPTEEQAETLDDYISDYHQMLVQLIKSGRYEKRDDFTVVIQPFMKEYKLPYKDNQQIDSSYFAPDCFHFSDKGHSQAALSLWNNMFEPVGSKRESWHMNESLKCPTKEYPYIFTSKNSANTSDERNRTNIDQITSREPIINNNNSTFGVNTTNNYTPRTTSNTFGVNVTGNYSSTVNGSDAFTSDMTNTTNRASPESISIGNVDTTTQSNDKKPDSDSSFSKMKFIAIIGFLFIISLILIIGIIRQRNERRFTRETRGNNYRHFNDELDDDEEEIYSQTKQKPNFFDNKEMPKTHGTRMSFE